MNKKIILLLSVIFIVVISALFVMFTNLSKNQSNQTAAPTVITIKNSELDAQVKRMETFYKFSNQDLKNYPTLQKDQLEILIENKIIENYASLHNITVSDSEVSGLYKQKIAKNGEEALLNQLNQMYGMGKQDYLEVLRMDLLKEKVQTAVKMPLADWLKIQKENIKIVMSND